MPRNWSREELAEALARNPGLRVTAPQAPLERAKRVEIAPAISTTPKVAAKPDLRREAKLSETDKLPETGSRQFPASTKPANGLHELMGAPSWRGPLQPEEHLSCAVAAELRRLTSAGRLRAVWSRIPGEHPEGGRYAMAQQIKRTAMGHVPGVPDLFFAWGSGAGFIELKTESPQGSLLAPSGKLGIRKGRRTYLRGRQRLFQAWAGQYGVHHAVARSVGEVLAVLRGWGILSDPTART